MQDLYKFLTVKCKERGIKIEELPERFDFQYSRTTIYRFMKGILRITKAVQALFVKLLDLNDAEQVQFARLISLSSFDETMLAARRRIDKFLFESGCIPEELPEIECAFYDQDKYFRTIDEIFNMVFSMAEHNGFSCDVKIIGCVQGGMLGYISDFTRKLLSLSASSCIEHLAALSDTDFLQNTVFLLDVLPLLFQGAYKVFYREPSADDGAKMMFGDSMFITCQYEENGVSKKKCFAVSFLAQAMPECIAFDDKHMRGFWMKNYAHLRMYYPNALTHMTDLPMMGDDLQKMESNCDEYLIKPNPCYHKIPMSVYRRLVGRVSPDEVRRIASTLNSQVRDDAEARYVLETMLLSLEKRIGSSYTNKHIDVYSKEGLAEFAKTGRISDHLTALPPFDKEEIRDILVSIRDRNLDPDDPYTLCLVDRLQHRYYFVIIKGHGLFIECDQQLSGKGVYESLYVRNRNLLEVFCDYIENHLPVNHALTVKETTAFIDELIERTARDFPVCE